MTLKSQENKKDQLEKATEIVDYLAQLNQLKNDYETQLILQMDETPTYIDSTTNLMVSQKGASIVKGMHTGNDKLKITSILSIAADGTRLPTYVIFKKLLEVPYVNSSANIVLNRSESGFMANYLMKDYTDKVLLPYTKGKKALLVLDHFTAHKSPSKLGYLADNNITPYLIPG